MALNTDPKWRCTDKRHRGQGPPAVGVAQDPQARDPRKLPRCEACRQQLAADNHQWEFAYLLTRRLRRAPQHDITPELKRVHDFLTRAVDNRDPADPAASQP